MTTYQGDSFFLDRQFPFYIERRIISKGEHIHTHNHDFVELVYVESGGAEHTISGQAYELEVGHVFVLEPNVYHSYTGGSGEDTVIYNVLFDRELLRREFDVLRRIPPAAFVPFNPLKPHQRLQLELNLEVVHKEFTQRPEDYRMIINARLIECLILLSRFHRENHSGRQNRLTDRERINSIVQFVEQHYSQPIALTQLSRTCGMSVSSITEKFKSLTGQSLFEYKQAVQINQACGLLTDSGKKVLEVAYQVGFNDLSFFNKIFKKHTGMTPRQFRLLGQQRRQM